MNNSPEIENIIEQSISYAKEFKHEYVTIEHLLLGLITFAPFKKCLNGFGCETDLMIDEIRAYLQSLTSIERSDNETPRKTNALERVMNRSVTQVLFTGRRQVTTVDLYLSIISEGNTHAHYFLLKYGVNKQEFLAYWQRHYKGGEFSK